MSNVTTTFFDLELHLHLCALLGIRGKKHYNEFMGYDYTYIIYVLPAVALSLVAQFMVKSRFAKFNNVVSKKGLTGSQAAAFLLKANGINDVRIQRISGSLTDNYNPSSKILSLSESTFASSSIAAIGVAAHETGHAIQHHVNYFPLNFRKALVPVANFGSRFGPTLAVLGLILGSGVNESLAVSSGVFYMITNIGLFLFAMSMLFYLVTLPVEFNASGRALKILKETNTLNEDEIKGVKQVLWAAAMTYVAAALTSIGSFVRLLVITGRAKNSKRSH